MIKISNFATDMNKLFHRRFTLGAKCGITLCVLMCCYFFWQKMALPAAVLMVITVVMVERVIHSTYTFANGELIIDRGRFARRLCIRTGDIVKCTPMRSVFGLSHYLLLHYGAGHLLAVQPEDEEAFVREWQKRLQTEAGARPAGEP